MRHILCSLVLLGILFCTDSLFAENNKPKVAVMPLAAKRVPKTTVEILDVLLVNAVYDLEQYSVVGMAEIQAMLGFERLKDALACDDVACAASIGGALGVDFLLLGTVGRLGQELFISLTLMDTHAQKAAMRKQMRIPAKESFYADAISDVVVSLLGPDKASAKIVKEPETKTEAQTKPSKEQQLENEPKPIEPETESSIQEVQEPVAKEEMTSSTNSWAWITLGTGAVMAAGAGAMFLSKGNKDDILEKETGVSDAIRSHNTKVYAGWGLAAGAAVCAGLSAYLFATVPDEPNTNEANVVSAPSVSIAPTQGGAFVVAQGAF